MLDSCAICLSLPEPSQNSLAVISAFTASVLKVAVNHTTGRRPLFGMVYIVTTDKTSIQFNQDYNVKIGFSI